MESEDYSFYQGLVFLLENHVDDLGYELNFSTEVRRQFNLRVLMKYHRRRPWRMMLGIVMSKPATALVLVAPASVCIRIPHDMFHAPRSLCRSASSA